MGVCRVFIVLLAALIVAACAADDAGGGSPDGTPDGPSNEFGDGEIVTLAKVEGWRDNFENEHGFPYIVLEIAETRDHIDAAWSANVPNDLAEAASPADGPGIYVAREAVDWDTYALVVFSSGESGTCPEMLTRLELHDDRIDVDVEHVGGPYEACTDDFRPYRQLFALPVDQLPEQLPVDRIDVPSRNLTDVEGRAISWGSD